MLPCSGQSIHKVPRIATGSSLPESVRHEQKARAFREDLQWFHIWCQQRQSDLSADRSHTECRICIRCMRPETREFLFRSVKDNDRLKVETRAFRYAACHLWLTAEQGIGSKGSSRYFSMFSRISMLHKASISATMCLAPSTVQNSRQKSA